LQALKTVVVVMGIMLVVGFAALIGIIAERLSHRGIANGSTRPVASATIDIPRGARVEAMTTASDRLILDLELPDGGRKLVVLDLATGARLGTIELRPIP
jgi:hypothetical protein